jgi:glycosyltransferase involved in cell wall biosynthesis
MIFKDLLQIGVWPEIDRVAYILLGVALLMFLLNLCMRVWEFYVLKGRVQVDSEREERYGNPTEGVSVIITVNNNAELLSKNLPLFLNQNYPNFEVIVVDEASDDDTIDVLNILTSKYSNLRVSRLYPGVKFHRTKKIALNIGILAAKNDILLFSEIYCAPRTDSWIREMAAQFSVGTNVVIGGSYYPQQNRGMDFLRLNHNIHTLSRLFMCRAGVVEGPDLANYGYRKSLYLMCRGFSRNNQQLMGYEREMVKKILELKPASYSWNFSNNAAIDYMPIMSILVNDEEYYYAEKREWSIKSILIAGAPQWLRLITYILIVALTIFAHFPIWFAAILFLLTFFGDFWCLFFQMRTMLQRKLFITSLMSNTICFVGRWGSRVKTLASVSRWK